MTAQLRAELLKQRSTRTNVGLFLAMLGLVLFAVPLHGFALGTKDMASRFVQLTLLFGWGEKFGALFAGLLGAMSITGEIRHGTIRPTFLVTPRRARVVAGKVFASMLAGIAFGLIAGIVAAGVGTAALQARGIKIQLDVGDYVLLVAGAAAAAALWAAIGVGLGALLRNQVTTLVGITAWLLFVEDVLVHNVADVGRFAPGAAGQALSGQGPGTLLAPAVGALLLAVYAAAAIGAGTLTMIRRDVP